jgi:phosphonate transport system substrate-binding protein
LRITTIQSPNSEFIPAAVAEYLGKKLGIETEFVAGPEWRQREQRLDAGEIEIGWVCGLPYTWKAADPEIEIELLAAPVMAGERYAGKPVYFSDVIVQAGSRFEKFEDLRGARWAFNEPHSHSGYNVTRYHLASIGEKDGFFGEVIEAGSHQNAIKLVLDGKIDASAIDSTVLEIEYELDPALKENLRVIEALGPSPIPPYVISTRVDAELRQQIREGLLAMDKNEEGQRILAKAKMLRFAAVMDADYDVIREMESKARGVVFD